MAKALIKIMYLMDYYGGPKGGTERQVYELIKGLDRHIFQPSLTVFQWTHFLGHGQFVCPISQTSITGLLRPDTVPCLLHLSHAIRRSGVKIVHIYLNDAAVAGPIFAKIGGAKVVVSRRDMGFWYTPKFLLALRFANRFVDRFIANSSAVKHNVAKYEKVPSDKIEVIHNGFDINRFDTPASSDLLKRLGIRERDPVIGMVANLYPMKRPKDLLRAFRLLLQEHPNAHLVYVGGGEPEILPVRHLANEFGIGSRVHFLGSVMETISIIKLFSVCVLASESEGLSNAIIEYMGCGKPVVCCRTGGNPELITDGFSGFLIEVGDFRAMANRIHSILADPALGLQMGKNAQINALERFSASTMLQSHMRMYENLLNNSP